MKQSPKDNSSKQTNSYTWVSQAGSVIRTIIPVTKNYIVTNSNCWLGRIRAGRQREGMNESNPLTAQREDKSRSGNPFRMRFSREAVTGLLAEMHSHSARCWNHTESGAPAFATAELSLVVTASWHAIPNSRNVGKTFLSVCWHFWVCIRCTLLRWWNSCYITQIFMDVFPQHDWEM